MKFTKYVSSGNDFIVVADQGKLDRQQIVLMCDRHFGIGADGVLHLKTKEQPWKLDIYNADGSKAQMCGNGLKIMAHYLHELCPKEHDFKVLIHQRIYTISCDPKKGILLPFPEPLGRYEDYQAYHIGNRHLLRQSEKMDLEELKREGQKHPSFNVSHYQWMDSTRIALQTYERGVGLTLSCGSASIAAAYEIFLHGYERNEIQIQTRGGRYAISYGKQGLRLKGSVIRVYQGEWWRA